MSEVPLYSSQSKINHFTEMCSGSEAGSYLRLIDFCITQSNKEEDLRAKQYSSQSNNNHFTKICTGSEAGSYSRLTDACITQL